jgi:hypothetical protein
MSLSAYWVHQHPMELRSMYTRAGARATAKRATARRTRRAPLPQPYPDNVAVSAGAPAPDNVYIPVEDIEFFDYEDDLGVEFSVVEQLEEEIRIPAHLEGSLPDWMLERMEQSKGDAFHHLAYFEAKPSVKHAPSFYDLDD